MLSVGKPLQEKVVLRLNLPKVNGVIVNADAFQVYKELDIGTAKPTIEERQIVPHYLLINA